jgi:hypothetical protein
MLHQPVAAGIINSARFDVSGRTHALQTSVFLLGCVSEQDKVYRATSSPDNLERVLDFLISAARIFLIIK